MTSPVTADAQTYYGFWRPIAIAAAVWGGLVLVLLAGIFWKLK